MNEKASTEKNHFQRLQILIFFPLFSRLPDFSFRFIFLCSILSWEFKRKLKFVRSLLGAKVFRVFFFPKKSWFSHIFTIFFSSFFMNRQKVSIQSWDEILLKFRRILMEKYEIWYLQNPFFLWNSIIQKSKVYVFGSMKLLFNFLFLELIVPFLCGSSSLKISSEINVLLYFLYFSDTSSVED